MTKVIESHPDLNKLLNEFKKETLAEEALRILEPIPEDHWCTGWYSNSSGHHCALGWMGHAKNVKPQTTRFPISDRVMEFLKSRGVKYCLGITEVNDGELKLYPQTTAKQRIIALLQDMIKAGY